MCASDISETVTTARFQNSFVVPSVPATTSPSSLFVRIDSTTTRIRRVIHDAQSTLRYTRTAVWLLALAFLPFLSLFQSARMLREVVSTVDTTIAFVDVPTLLHHRRHFSQQDAAFFPRRHLHDVSSSSSSDHPLDTPNLHIVISHCDQPIDWIWKHYLWNQPYKSMTILSKCRRPPTLEQLPPVAALPTTIHNTSTSMHHGVPLIQVLELPNVGRCDHSYAYWMSKLLGNVAVDEFISHRLNFSNDRHNNYETVRLVEIYDTDKDLILFMKDNDNAYRANMDIEIPLHHIMESIFINDQQQQDDDDEEENSKSNEVNGAETLSKNKTSSSEAAISTTTFACGTKLRTGFPGFYRKNLLTVDDRERASNLADRRLLWTFQQGEYSSSAGLLQRSEDHGDFVARYRPMGKWVQHLQFDLNAFEDGFFEGTYQNQNYDIVPVCFGGNFVTSWGTIQNSPIRNWTAIVESLSRGDNIEEGHYMERLWAHLFSPAFTKEKRNAILQRTSRQFSDGAFAGMIVTLSTD